MCQIHVVVNQCSSPPGGARPPVKDQPRPARCEACCAMKRESTRTNLEVTVLEHRVAGMPSQTA